MRIGRTIPMLLRIRRLVMSIKLKWILGGATMLTERGIAIPTWTLLGLMGVTTTMTRKSISARNLVAECGESKCLECTSSGIAHAEISRSG